MNKRIEELAKLADPDFQNEFDDMSEAIVGLDAIEKFAELIILECADIATYHFRRLEDGGVAIKEYFGVE